jgi:cell division protein FtsB
MNLNNFVSLSEQIKTLEKQILRLTEQNKILQNRYNNLNKKHCKSIPAYRGRKAVVEINRLKSEGFVGSIKDNVKIIAVKYDLSVSWVFRLWNTYSN